MDSGKVIMERVKKNTSYRLSEAHGEKFFRKEFSRQPSGKRVSIMDDTHKSHSNARAVSIEARNKARTKAHG